MLFFVRKAATKGPCRFSMKGNNMIINTGQRTDIPAFYAEWFCNRLREGSVLVRSPYNPQLLTRYRLTPDVVDVIGMCTKNPAPMLPHLHLLQPFGQYWYVTITPYGREIEPYVPGKRQVRKNRRRCCAGRVCGSLCQCAYRAACLSAKRSQRPRLPPLLQFP